MKKNMLIINAGSSSIKIEIFDNKLNSIDYKIITNINDILPLIEKYEIQKIGYRVVHGGKYTKPIELKENIIKYLNSNSNLAPLHNPKVLEIIKFIKSKKKNLKHIAVFDTSFHTTIPLENKLYGLPYELYSKHKIMKYGFHGISHEYLKDEGIKLLKQMKKNHSKIITCHLGSGSSLCAVKNGKSFDTSLGFTPNEGLIMSTRSGEIDPGIIFYLNKEMNYSFSKINQILNYKSGLLGISGISSKTEILIKSKSKRAKLAITMFVNHITTFIGAYYASMGGCDAIIFSGGIGEKSSYIREKVIKKIAHLGFDLNKNYKSKPVIIIHAKEELAIAKKIIKLSLIKN